MKEPVSQSRRECVVLIPGLWLLGASLGIQARRLRSAGFDVHLVSYATVRQSLKDNALHISRITRELEADTIHYVGHSLGGIVIRALFHFYPDPRPGRVVTIASPHMGSEVAKRFSRYALGRVIVGESIRELLDGIPQQWPLPSREIGLIRGNLPIGLGRFFPGLPSPNDGLLTEQETWLEGVTDNVTLPIAHTGMLFAPAVADAVSRFLRTGQFANH